MWWVIFGKEKKLFKWWAVMRTRKNLPQVFVIFKLNYCMACGLILEKCYVHNIFTPLS